MLEKLPHRINMEGYPYQRPRLSKYGVHNTAKYSDYRKKLCNALKECNIPTKDYEYLRVHFYFPYAKSQTQKGRVDNAPMNKKYDIDNLIKGFMDGLQDSGIISDDRCICGVYAEKIFSVENFGWIEFEFE
jgi:Holliday junction resolvase RusA-like endonuclease